MDNKKKIVIAIDGFSSCGKSTFAKAIAAAAPIPCEEPVISTFLIFSFLLLCIYLI